MAKPPILYLVHRIPYPPDKGDKIRSFNILKTLSQHFEVHLVAFIDDHRDQLHAAELNRYCRSTYFSELTVARKLLKAVFAIVRGRPISVEAYRSTAVAVHIRALIDEYSITRALAFSGGVAQYLNPDDYPEMTEVLTVADLVDVDSDKWFQFSSKTNNPLKKWIYQREAGLLENYEHSVVGFSNRTYFVSEAEAVFFRERLRGSASKVGSSPNGVDMAYFDPDLKFPAVSAEAKKMLVFTGAMDYWPNEDAVCWFVKQVYAMSTDIQREFTFYIVGSNPTSRVRALAQYEGVHVTGRVEDVRPYLAQATAAVVPIEVARGVQNKILEAMAIGLPVITTQKCIGGINARPNEHYLPADVAGDFEDILLTLNHNDITRISLAARELIEREYVWESALRPQMQFLIGRP